MSLPEKPVENQEKTNTCPKCFNHNDGMLVKLEKFSGFIKNKYVRDKLLCLTCGHLEAQHE